MVQGWLGAGIGRVFNETNLAQVMVNVALYGAEKVIFENRDIREYSI